jgi:uncharacterized protein (TIGR02996 family)
MPCPVPGLEEAALLQAIKDSDPADNAVRQVYADFLLDQGRDEHANLVRYQKDHDDPFSAYGDPGLGTPEGRAVRDYAERTLLDWVGAVPADVNVQFRRGLLHAVIPMPRFLEGRYGAGLAACRRAGWVETIELIDVWDVHLKRLPYAMTRPSERLAVRGDGITRAGLDLLEKVPRLESVDLMDYFWGDEGDTAEIVIRLAQIPGLRRLLWWGSELSQRALAPLAGRSDLRCLCLDNVGEVRDDWFTPVFSLTGLRHLSITRGWSLTDAFLLGLESLVNLRFLCLANTGTFSREGLARLRRALPGCVVQTGERYQ